MAEALASYLSGIKNGEELYEKLGMVHPDIRGKVAELTGDILIKKAEESGDNIEITKPPKHIEKFRDAFTASMFATKCYEIALESYTAKKDTEGIKRIGDTHVRLGNFKA